MRIITDFWTSAILLALPSTARHAQAFLSHYQPPVVDPVILSPSATRLVIAQRFGVSYFHPLDETNEQTIRAIDEFGSNLRPIFFREGDDQRVHNQALIIIEGVKDATDSSFISGSPAFLLEHPPPSDASAVFLNDLISQHASMHGDLRTLHVADSLDRIHSGSGNTDYIYHSSKLQALADKHGSSSDEYMTEFRNIITQIDRVFSTCRSNTDITVIAMPEAEKSTGLFGRSSPSSWGEYTKVSRQDLATDPSEFISPERFEFQSTVGSVPSSSPATGSSMSSVGTAGEVTLQQPNSTIEPPKGILPVCFSKLDQCESLTHGCSGHGVCRLKYETNGGSSSSHPASCFQCACDTERKEVGNGQYKSTVWSGPACQKKDVSVPFWLLFGTTITLLIAITWGVGTLYSMGSEELPSVIGAGVAGIGARGK